MGAAIASRRIRVGGIVIDRERSPDTVPSLVDRKSERGRHDADYRVEVAAQSHTASNDRRIGTELRSPQGMADQGDAGAYLLFVRGKPPSKFRMNAKRGQKIPRYDLGIQLNGSLQSCQRKQIVVVADQVIERVIL